MPISLNRKHKYPLAHHEGGVLIQTPYNPENILVKSPVAVLAYELLRPSKSPSKSEKAHPDKNKSRTLCNSLNFWSLQTISSFLSQYVTSPFPSYFLLNLKNWFLTYSKYFNAKISCSKNCMNIRIKHFLNALNK